jgi:hypothetical protein
MIGTLIGAKGSTIRGLQSRTAAQIQVNAQVVSVRGATAGVKEAICLIHNLLGPELEEYLEAQRKAEQETRRKAQDVESECTDGSAEFPIVPPGANPNLAGKLTGAAQKKLRRKRKKKVVAGPVAPEEVENVEDACNTLPETREYRKSEPVTNNSHAEHTQHHALDSESEGFDTGVLERASAAFGMKLPVGLPANNIHVSKAVPSTENHVEISAPIPVPASAPVSAPVPVGPALSMHSPSPLMTAGSAPVPQGRADQLLAMLLDDRSAGRGVSGTQSRQPGRSTSGEDKAEYYTSSSGFKIRL